MHVKWHNTCLCYTNQDKLGCEREFKEIGQNLRKFASSKKEFRFQAVEALPVMNITVYIYTGWPRNNILFCQCTHSPRSPASTPNTNSPEKRGVRNVLNLNKKSRKWHVMQAIIMSSFDRAWRHFSHAGVSSTDLCISLTIGLQLQSTISDELKVGLHGPIISYLSHFQSSEGETLYTHDKQKIKIKNYSFWTESWMG